MNYNIWKIEFSACPLLKEALVEQCVNHLHISAGFRRVREVNFRKLNDEFLRAESPATEGHDYPGLQPNSFKVMRVFARVSSQGFPVQVHVRQGQSMRDALRNQIPGNDKIDVSCIVVIWTVYHKSFDGKKNGLAHHYLEAYE